MKWKRKIQKSKYPQSQRQVCSWWLNFLKLTLGAMKVQTVKRVLFVGWRCYPWSEFFLDEQPPFSVSAMLASFLGCSLKSMRRVPLIRKLYFIGASIILLTWLFVRYTQETFTETCHHTEAFQDNLHSLASRLVCFQHNLSQKNCVDTVTFKWGC